MTHKIVLNGSWFWIHSVGSERFLKSTNAELVYKTILRINIEEEICWQDKGCEERRRQWWKEQWKTNSSGKDYKENTILIKILTMLLRAFLTRTYREDRENPRKGKWDEICHRQFYDWTKICLKTFNVFNLSLILLHKPKWRRKYERSEF